MKNESIEQRVGERLLLFQVKLGTLFEFNAVGEQVWHLCDGRHSIDEIVTEMKKSTSEEIVNFISELNELGLIGLNPKPRHSFKEQKPADQRSRNNRVTCGRPHVKKVWSERAATSGIFLVEI